MPLRGHALSVQYWCPCRTPWSKLRSAVLRVRRMVDSATVLEKLAYNGCASCHSHFDHDQPHIGLNGVGTYAHLRGHFLTCKTLCETEQRLLLAVCKIILFGNPV